MPELDRRLREVAQLRKIWRAFRDPQERLEDKRLARPIIDSPLSFPRDQESVAAHGRLIVRAAIRYWWSAREYAQIIWLSERLDPRVLDEEPLIQIYLEEARAHLNESKTCEKKRNGERENNFEKRIANFEMGRGY